MAGGEGAVPADGGNYAYPMTPAGFFCGDGVSLGHADPDDLDEGEGG